MTERERLAEMIHKAELQMCGKPVGDAKSQREFIADYLLDHGVLVFPCNVGAPVYTLLPDKQHYFKTRAFPLTTLAKWVQNGDFGSNVFLTREEAEAALAERRKASVE